jgi:hypothetical protein
MMKMVSCGALVLAAGLVACAAGSSAPQDPIELQSNSSGASNPVVLGSDAATNSQSPAPPSITIGSTGTPDAAPPPAVDSGLAPIDDDSGDDFDAGSPVDDDAGGGYDSGSYGYDSGSSKKDAGSGGTTTCKGYAPPSVTAGCTCTATDQSECQANGCYNGYWCDTDTEKCHEDAPSGC